ncbi:MAG: hypothetical protein HKL81_00775 [Acidimicrobiaceae bacterium]|nr:hypothetical protein [Acidimicrobiaceae bacterium]
MTPANFSEDAKNLITSSRHATLSVISSEFGVHSVLVNFVPTENFAQFYVLSSPTSRKVSNIKAHGVASLLFASGSSYTSISAWATIDSSAQTRSIAEGLFSLRYNRTPREATERVIIVLTPRRWHGQTAKGLDS